MAELYYLMRKDQPLTIMNLDAAGHILDYSREYLQKELLPIYDHRDVNALIRWWSERSVPINQVGIDKILEKNGYVSTEQYLISNLGLSLTDVYWMKPIDCNLSWKTVNLYSNDFTSDRLMENTIEKIETPYYSPNGSLQGNIEKTWTIIDGKRCLVKGNRGSLSTQSLNEVFVSEIYKKQNYDNYTQYHLMKIAGKPYDYGCYSENFTSETVEFVSGHQMIISEKKKNHVSEFEHFIEVCVKNGMDEELLRYDLEMQILVDFIVSGYDRHYNNFGVLRDVDTLKMIRLAPIFDSGEAFFTGISFPNSKKDLLEIKTAGFSSSERSLMEKVKDKRIVDISKLPSEAYVRELYEKDSKASPQLVNHIIEWYKIKVDMLEMMQKGKDPFEKRKRL